MKTTDQELILDYLHSRPSVDATKLNDLLRDSDEARAFLRSASAAEVRLRELALRDPVADFRPKTAKISTWMRSVTQMAAGIVLGGLAVGAVWAYAAPKGANWRDLPLFDGGFESGLQKHKKGVPNETGRWAGDPRMMVTEHEAIKPHQGERMLRFMAAQSDDDKAGAQRSSSDLWQVVDLPGKGVRRVQVRARFNAATKSQARFQIFAVVGDGDVSTAPELWKQSYQMTSQVPAASRALIYTDLDPGSWQSAELVLQVPANARFLVIGLQAFRQADGFPGQFVDDVSVSISEEVLP